MNEALRKVSGTLKSTPLPWLPCLANELNALKNLISNTRFYKNVVLFEVLKEKPPERLVSRTAIWKITDAAMSFDPNMEWNISWENFSVLKNEFIVDPTLKVNGFGLPRKVWVT